MIIQGKGEPRITMKYLEWWSGEFHIPLPRLNTKIWITLSLFTNGQNYDAVKWTKWIKQLGKWKCEALPKAKTYVSLSNLWVWKLAHLFESKSVSKRQTNNLRSFSMREMFLNVLGEKLLTELKVDFRFVRRRYEPNQSGLLLANNFKWIEVNANLWAIGMYKEKGYHKW